MLDAQSLKPDPFSQRLQEALNRVPKQAAAPAEPPPPADEVSERLRRALKAARVNGGGSAADAGASSSGAANASAAAADPALQTVIESWPELPAFVKSFIVNMVQANRSRDRQATA